MREKDELRLNNVISRFKQDGDKINILHVQDTDDILEVIKDEKTYGDNGWTDGRRMRKKGTIPEIFLRMPRYSGALTGNQKEFEEASNRFFADHPEFCADNGNKKYL